MKDLIRCEGLTKRYGKKVALWDFSVGIPAGRIIGLLGPNGSGKTTLIKSLSGILMPDAGKMEVAGKEIGVESKGKPIGVDSKKVISYLPERPYFSSALKVKDTLNFFEDFYEDFQRKAAEEMLKTLQIDKNSKMGALSKGTKRKNQ